MSEKIQHLINLIINLTSDVDRLGHKLDELGESKSPDALTLMQQFVCTGPGLFVLRIDERLPTQQMSLITDMVVSAFNKLSENCGHKQSVIILGKEFGAMEKLNSENMADLAQAVLNVDITKLKSNTLDTTARHRRDLKESEAKDVECDDYDNNWRF